MPHRAVGSARDSTDGSLRRCWIRTDRLQQASLSFDRALLAAADGSDALYERGSIIVTSIRGFESWGEMLGDATVAAALIDRLVQHATMISPQGQELPAPRPRRRLPDAATAGPPTSTLMIDGAGLAGYAGSHSLAPLSIPESGSDFGSC